ncbi:glycerophosphodiester phosphodiesterase family protein [Neisseria leonii]|uniref:Glycerophosphodiester phosphodiesterase family protein n=1 Tax=Neisseria leonii TaxID=2995413 RepID=A0A9X4E5L1_9NEIS|nr:glycerophosphodiester phosphodiesterase family protein [Neisseria sp. 51.81]MDD9327842.1 hypothetical protein [Neisseria sp. 51.81]
MKPLTAICLILAANSALAAPKIIAHRAGAADAPENTVFAIGQALKNRADMIWITVQLSKDNIPVLYRPISLSANTDAEGRISDYTAAQLAKLNAGFRFQANGRYPFRNCQLPIPTLEEVLKRYPQTPFLIDLKSPDADPAVFAQALTGVIERTGAKDRVRFYSTEPKFIQSIGHYPTFADRSQTRAALAQAALAGEDCGSEGFDREYWHGFELNRKVKVVEKFTLGEGASDAILTWSAHEMDCFNRHAPQKVILFGINTWADYRKAEALGAYGIMTDTPKRFNTGNRHR